MTELGTPLRPLAAIVANAALLAAAWFAATRLACPTANQETAKRGIESLETWLAFAVLLPAMVVLTVQAAGVASLLNRPIAVFALATVIAAGVMAWSLRMGAKTSGAASLGRATIVGGPAGARATDRAAIAERRSLIVAVVATLLTLIPLLCNRAVLPPVAWDALTYHLPFGVTWLQRGDLATPVPAAGDAAHTYYPLVGQMLLYWNLISSGSDRWAVLSQLPFLVAGGVAVAAVAIRCGASNRLAALAALVWAGTPVVLRQSVEVMLDVEQAAFFAIAVYFTLSSRRGGGTHLVLGWLALALVVGVKYSGLILALPLLPVLGVTALRRRPGDRQISGLLRLAGGGIVLAGTGGYAYLRNAVSCGNPFMPLRIALGPWVPFPGPIQASEYFGASAPRLGWGALLASPRSILEMGFLFLPLLLLLLLGVWQRGNDVPASSNRRLLAWVGLGAFILSAILLPFREHRYFIPVTAAACALAAASFESWGRRTWIILAVPIALVVQAPVTLVYALKDFAILGARPEHGVALGAILIMIMVAGLLWRRAGVSSATVGILPRRNAAIAAAAVAVVVLAVATDGAYERARYAHWTWFWGTRHEWDDRAHARGDLRDMAAAWAWIAERTKGAPSVVAYAGLNSPYPRSGYGFRNRVTFVPRSGPPGGTLYRWRAPPFASARQADAPAWRSNMVALGVNYLCLFRSSVHDGGTGAFPVEDEWVRQEPGRFDLAWASEWSRIYLVKAP